MLDFPTIARLVGSDEPKVLRLADEALEINPGQRVNNEQSYSQGFALAIGGREIDARMFAQQAAFTIHGNPGDLREVVERTSVPWRKAFLVPNESKEELRELLRRLSIHKSSLFPDLGALAAELKSRFS
jgi:hypothetical protein